jgi:hypothetical protein
MHEDAITPKQRVPRVTKICRKCKRPFEVLASQSLQTGRPYCRPECAYEDRKTSMETRFWAAVEKTPGCWTWKRALSHGYGVLPLPGHAAGWVRADLFSYELHYGALPADGKIHHVCPGGPNHACVNPAHLAAGSKPRKPRKPRPPSANPRPARLDRICQRPDCGAHFTVQPAIAARGHGLYCSRDCQAWGNSRPLAERFWEKVDKNGPLPPEHPELGPCWIWTGATTQGYGVINDTRASHIALALDSRPLTPGQWACHRCDVHPCVRFDHLFAGSPTDNNRDAVLKGHKGRRGPQGSGELNPVAVRVIRFLYATGRFSQVRLAAAHRISQSTAARVISRRIWDHVE